MANPTTYFGWVMPTATDLVTDLPADFAVFGQGVDTSMQFLLGGTTGQVLSKTSGTNMAFTWINNDQGDITGVTAGTGISGGGTSGTVTVTNSMATEITAAGDIIVGTGSGTFDNLPIGTTAQVLTADTTVSPYKVKWATPASGSSGLTLISTTSFTTQSTQTFNSIFSATYQNYVIYLNIYPSVINETIRFYWRASGTNNTSANYNWGVFSIKRDGTDSVITSGNDVANMSIGTVNNAVGAQGQFCFNVYSPFAGITRQSYTFQSFDGNANGSFGWGQLQGYASTQFDGFALTPASGTFGGTMSVYGVAK